MKNLDSLFERALDAVVGMDSDGRVTAWNGAAETMFGWSKSEAMGASMGDLIVPDQHRSAHANGLDHYNRTGEGPVLEKRVTITAMHRDGTVFPIELSIFPMIGDDGTRFFYGFIRSLAESEAHRREQDRRRIEAEILLKIARKLLEDVTAEAFTQFCLREVCGIAGLEAGHLFMVRGATEQKVLVPTSVWHISQDSFQPVIDVTEGLRLGPGEGLPGRAWKSGDLMVQDDIATDTNFLRRDTFCRVGLTRGMALPISCNGQIYAVLEFFGTEASRFDKDMLRLVQTIGAQVGIALCRVDEAETRETMRREMEHRMSNSLAITSSIFRSLARSAQSIEDLSASFESQIMAISRANKLVIQEADRGLPLARLIRDALDILPDARDISVAAADLVIDQDCVMPLTLILNELATNGLKYGGVGGEATLAIQAIVCERTGDLWIKWNEQLHTPLKEPPEAPTRSGFGSKLLDAMVRDRLGGAYERGFDMTGFRFHIRIPLAKLAVR